MGMDDPTGGPAPALTVIIPCFNEEQRLPATLTRLREYLDGRGVAYEFLVVDDGSLDATQEVARAAVLDAVPIQVLQYGGNRGKGFAVAFGALRARGRLVLFTDADLSTPIEEMAKLELAISRGADVAIGSRALPESRLEVRQPWWRERTGRLMNRLIRRLSGLPYADTQCGFKLFTRPAARAIFSQLTVERWMFDVEVLILARKLNLTVEEIPVRWLNSGESRVRLAHAPGIFGELLHIRVHWMGRQPAPHCDEGLGARAGG